MEKSKSTVSHDDCLTILHTFLGNSSAQLKNFEVLPFHKQLLGLVCQHFILRIDYNNGESSTQNFFMKTLSGNPLMASFSQSIGVYEKEKFFYHTLLPEFERLQIDVSFSPKGYFFIPYVVVLEDVSLSGYRGTPKRELLDLEHSRVCVEALANLHAAGIIYQERRLGESGDKFTLLEQYPEELAEKWTTSGDSVVAGYFRNSIKGIFEMAELVPDLNVDEFRARLGAVLEKEPSAKGSVSTVLHNDLWSSNFLYVYEEGIPVRAKILDYQTVTYGPIEEDLLKFLMTTTSHALRAQHYDFLIKHYYDTLSDLLIGAGLESGKILPTSCEFLQSCELFKLVGKLHAIVDHSFTFISDEIYGDAMRAEESLRTFFEERGRYIVDSFRTNSEFRNMLKEDVYELRDLLPTGDN